MPRHHRRVRNRSAGVRNLRRGTRRPGRSRSPYLWPILPTLLRILTHVADDPSGLLDLVSTVARGLGGWTL